MMIAVSISMAATNNSPWDIATGPVPVIIPLRTSGSNKVRISAYK